MEWLAEYSLFLAESATLLVLVVFGVVAVVSIIYASRNSDKYGRLQVENLSLMYGDLRRQVSADTPAKGKEKKKKGFRLRRKEAKAKRQRTLPAVYVLDFVGDMNASGVVSLREEISAVLLAAGKKDEVLIRLDSGGGTVSGYGLLAAQLARLRKAKIRLTVAIDQVAASGGYLAACVANCIIAAPFATIGSLGVILQLPNLHRLLKEHKIDYEMITAGENKRNLTLFGEVGEAERERARAELNRVHKAFLAEVGRYRPTANLAEVGEGDIWLASEAQALGLVDELGTSDDWLIKRMDSHNLLRLEWRWRKSWRSRLRAEQNAIWVPGQSRAFPSISAIQ